MSEPATPTTPTSTEILNVPVLPLRDVVVYPHMVIPLFVGREKSIQALDVAMRTDKRIMLVAQKQADVDDPKADDLYRIATVATILQLLKLPDGTVKVLVEGVDRARIDKLHAGEYYASDASLLPDAEVYDEKEMDVLARSVISQFEQYVKLNKKVPPGGADRTRRDRAGGTPRRHGGGAHVAQARRKAEGSRDPGRQEAPRAHPGRHRERDGRAADREAHPRARQGADGEEPARVLPQRADEGHSERARRDGRGRQRDQRARAEDRQGRHAQGGARQGWRRAQQAQDDVAHVGRGHRGAQLHRLARQGSVEEAHPHHQGHRPRPEGAGRGPLWPRQGQGTHRRVSRGTAAGGEAERTDPVSRRSAGRRQDLARPEHRALHEPQVRAHVARRRAR